jgi:UDP-MurNAc hydroxylase
MRFTIVGHAGLYVESGRTDLLVDPWLFGSCYWRSWWHYPPIAEIEPEWLTPRYVYLSHHHFDHFHYPSLRRIHREAHILVPRFGVDIMRSELAGLGFHQVSEMPHGVALELGDGLVARSFQYGIDDSTLVVSHGDTVIADFNDCKVRGTALRHLLGETGTPTFLLKNYSAAQAYPGCYRAEQSRDLEMISRHSYLIDFLGTAAATAPRYAVPFASMTCFLHPETVARNEEIVRPADLVAEFERSPVPGTELVVMAPGDSWDEEGGFSVAPADPFADFAGNLAVLQAEAGPSVVASLAEEETRVLRYDAFRDFFGEFVRSLPPGVPRLFHGSVAFLVPGDELPYWVVDLRRRRVYRASSPPHGWASVVQVPPGVLADAMEKKIVNFIHISMRLQVVLNEGGVGTDFMFWGLLTIFELGYFPLRRLPFRRVASVAWARRREFMGMAWSQVAGKGTPAERMASSLMPSGSESAAP